MDYITERKTSFLKLLLLFILFSIAGTLLSIVYVLLMSVVTYVYIKIIILALYIALLVASTLNLMKALKISGGYNVIIAICFGLIVFNYIKWNFYFGLTMAQWGISSDILYNTLVCVLNPQWFMDTIVFLSENLLLTYEKTEIPSAVIWVMWGGELLLIVAASIESCFLHKGIYINESEERLEPVFFDCRFTAFNKDDISKIMGKDISPIPEHRFINNNSKNFWMIGYFSVNGGPYEYIALYKNFAFFTGQKAVPMKNSALIKKTPLIYIGDDLFKQLQNGLWEKYFTKPNDKAVDKI